MWVPKDLSDSQKIARMGVWQICSDTRTKKLISLLWLWLGVTTLTVIQNGWAWDSDIPVSMLQKNPFFSECRYLYLLKMLQQGLIVNAEVYFSMLVKLKQTIKNKHKD